MHVCSVYQLGPRSWKPDASLSQTVTELDIQQTCRLSQEILMSEFPESIGDAYQLPKPVDDIDRMSSHPGSQRSNCNSDVTRPVEDTSSMHCSKLTWSASGGIKQSVASDDDNELVLLLFAVI